MLVTKSYDAQTRILLFENVLRNDPVHGRANIISHRSDYLILLVTLMNIRERHLKNLMLRYPPLRQATVSLILSQQGRRNSATKKQMKRPRTANQTWLQRGRWRRTRQKRRINLKLECRMTGSTVRFCASVSRGFSSCARPLLQSLRELTTKRSPLFMSQSISTDASKTQGIYGCSVSFVSYRHKFTALTSMKSSCVYSFAAAW